MKDVREMFEDWLNSRHHLEVGTSNDASHCPLATFFQDVLKTAVDVEPDEIVFQEWWILDFDPEPDDPSPDDTQWTVPTAEWMTRFTEQLDNEYPRRDDGTFPPVIGREALDMLALSSSVGIIGDGEA